ncbi:Uma2 family endonuclease [Synechococcus sp. PCC 7336]|uniref:Uma2 family endonuclease n=1 Tax=Synechococcus sp. PCC 7336 TaxID=195250 RepID=UPI00034A3DF6|nr:Uma2 family endonuclease [Synechococcus sp. PCC 7336]
MVVTRPVSQIELEPGSKIRIPNITWPEFEAILAELGDRRNIRMAYSHNTLELMSPLPAHERPNRMIGYIATALLDAQERDWEDFGATTFKRRDMAVGLEPDTCFYIDNAARVRDCDRINLDIDPPPDLAIETDVTSITTLEAYVGLQVPEVWIYANRKLAIYVLEDNRYIETNCSPTFGNLAIADWIPALVERALQVGSAKVLRQLRQQVSQMDWARQPRLPDWED